MMKVKRFDAGGDVRIYEYCVRVVIDSECFGPLPEFATYHYRKTNGKRVRYLQGVGEKKDGLPKALHTWYRTKSSKKTS